MAIEQVPVPSSVVNKGNVPGQDELWDVSAVFIANWNQPCILRSSFTTDVVACMTLAESRAGLRGKPRRLMTVGLQGLKIRDVAGLRAHQFRHSHSRSLVPIYSDHTHLDKVVPYRWATSSGGNAAEFPLSTGVLNFSLATASALVWSPAMSDGIVVMTGPEDTISTAVVAPTQSPNPPYGYTALGSITYTIPVNAVIVNNTTGDLSTTGPYNRTIQELGGSPTYTVGGTLDGSTSGLGQTTANMTGFERIDWTGMTKTLFQTKGWINAQGTASFRLWLVPFGPSEVDVTATGPETLACDPRYRRFFRDGRVLIATLRDDPELIQYEVAEIGEVGPNFLALKAPLAIPFVPEARIWPLIEARPVVEASGEAETDEVLSYQVAVQELVGPSALPAWVGPNEVLSDFDYLNGIPIFDGITYDWKGNISIGAKREEIVSSIGITDETERKGDRPLAIGKMDFLFLYREDAHRLLRFFDSRRGRTYPFLLPSPVLDLIYDGISTTTVSVLHHNRPEVDWMFFPYIVVGMPNGDKHLRRITSTTRTGNVDVLTVDPALPALTDVLQVRTAALMRFDTDEITETWQTDEVMRTSLPVREVEFDIAITTEVPDPRTETGHPPDPIPDYTPGIPPPEPTDPMYCQLRDCQNNLANLFVLQPTDPPLYLYNPDDNRTYTADCTAPTATPPGPVIDGWQRLPFAHDDPGNPSWVPACSAPPAAQDCATLPGACGNTLVVRVADCPDTAFNQDHTLTWDVTLGNYYRHYEDPPGVGRGVQLVCQPAGGWTISIGCDNGLCNSYSFHNESTTQCPPSGSTGWVQETGPLDGTKAYRV